MLVDESDWKDDGTVSCYRCGERIDQLTYIEHIFDGCEFSIMKEDMISDEDYSREPPVAKIIKIANKREKKKKHTATSNVIVPVVSSAPKVYELTAEERREIAEREALGIGPKNDSKRSTSYFTR